MTTSTPEPSIPAPRATARRPGPVPERFDGSVALVTGAAHGIGRACASRLAAEGAIVVAADRDIDAARVTASALPGDQHMAVVMDVTCTEDVERAVRVVVERFGHLDVLVNVAGGDSPHAWFEISNDEVWRAMLDLNLVSVARCCKAALPHLAASRLGPAIVNVSSVNAQTALGSEPYSSAKAGIDALTRNLAVNHSGAGVRVNGVAPATVRGRNWDGVTGGADKMEALYPLMRIGEPEDVAAAVSFLASADAAWITGHILPVDGGMLIGSAGIVLAHLDEIEGPVHPV